MKKSKKNEEVKTSSVEQERKIDNLIISVDYIDYKGNRKRDSFRTDSNSISGYALFLNLIVNNSVLAGSEFSVNVKIDKNETI